MQILPHAECVPEGTCACGGHHSHVQGRLAWMAVGSLFVINAFVLGWVFPEDQRVAAASALIGALALGGPIVWNAFNDLRVGALNTNVLVALAVLALVAAGHHQEAGVVSFFMLLGQIIETRTAEGALASIHSLVKLTPSKARRLNGSQEVEVAVQDLAPGDVIRLRPGDHVAADGVIVAGQSSLSEASITGESLPADKTVGGEVFAGTVNLTGMIEVRVTRAGHDTTLGRVRDLILAAERTKLPVTRLMDHYMGFYTPLVLVIGGLVWAFTHDLSRVVTVFIVSCPCAFVLATPTAMVAALSAAARLGILIKNVVDLESAARINAFVFDKTGTLTSGRLEVSRLAPLPGITAAELLRVAASVERFSNHPVGKALVRLADEVGLLLQDPVGFVETAGHGVKATIDGARVMMGRAKWLIEQGVDGDIQSSVDLVQAEGWSLVFVARENRCLGWIGLQDQTRVEAKQALADLAQLGVRHLALVSGDRQAVADRVGQHVGCAEIAGDCLPQDKANLVRRIRARGYRVAVVGDGVNDAPALAAGDMGVAMGAAGSEVAIHSATIALMNNDLRRLPFLLKISRQTRHVIKQNFLIGLGFVIGGMALGMLKYINPVAAALFHVSGSLLVVLNSFRLVRQGEDLTPHSSAPAGSGMAKPTSNADLVPLAGIPDPSVIS